HGIVTTAVEVVDLKEISWNFFDGLPDPEQDWTSQDSCAEYELINTSFAFNLVLEGLRKDALYLISIFPFAPWLCNPLENTSLHWFCAGALEWLALETDEELLFVPD